MINYSIPIGIEILREAKSLRGNEIFTCGRMFWLTAGCARVELNCGAAFHHQLICGSKDLTWLLPTIETFCQQTLA